jgi:S1-C subfamily serine protease
VSGAVHLPRLLLLNVLIAAAACAGSAPPAEVRKPPPQKPAQKARPAPSPSPPPGALWRADVVRTVNSGLGHFLQRVELEPSLKNGAFQGHRIVSLRPEKWWQGVDLKPGDVVTRVNGLPVERDIEAFKAFESLRTADQLTVSYLRAEEPRELTYRIIEQPGAAKPAELKPQPTDAGTVPDAQIKSSP